VLRAIDERIGAARLRAKLDHEGAAGGERHLGRLRVARQDRLVHHGAVVPPRPVRRP
jgi:hypothetical protein